MSDTKISEAAIEAALTSMEVTKNHLELTPRDRIVMMLAAALPHLHPQPAELADAGVIEHIAQQGDGCKYESPGETLDIGAAIRRAGKRLSAELAEQQGVSAPDCCEECGRRTFHNHPDGYICLHCKLVVETRQPNAQFALDALVAAGHVERSKVDQALAIGENLAATGKQQVGEVQGDARAMLRQFGAQRLREGSRAVGHDGPERNSWQDYIEVPVDVLTRIAAALAARQPGAQVPVAECLTGANITRLPAGRGLPPGTKLYAAPPAQGIDLGKIREIRIPARNNLDPISVFVQDQAAGRGRIVVTCYGNAWQAFWGAMGNRTVMEFVAQCDADYVAGNMLHGRQTRIAKHERAYTERIAAEVIAEFRTLLDQRDAATGVGNG